LETAGETGLSTSTWVKPGVNDIADDEETAALPASGVI
jgi:hypothetical protein